MTFDTELIKRAARTHFWAFCNHQDPEFFQSRKFLKPLAMGIQALYDGIIKRLSASLPPRAGKSYMATLASAYFLGRSPTKSVMRNSATAKLYMEFSYHCRDIVNSRKFKEVFPLVNLRQDKQAVTGWSLEQSKQVAYFGGGIGGTIVGFGASGLAITDDLYRGHEDALSETINDKIHLWLQSEHTSRLEGKVPELDIGTRWTKRDIIGSRMERDYYDRTIIIPALNENDETFCEEVKSSEDYKELRNITDPFIWVSEYQQKPIESEGLVFPADQLKHYTDKNNNRGYRIAFVDTADEGEDYLSMPIVEFFKETNTGYLVDVVFNQDNLSTNEGIIMAKAQEHDLDQLVIETNKEGTYFVNTLRRKLKVPIYGQFNSTNKITRIMAQSGFIIQNFRFKDDQGPVYRRFMNQLTTYLRTGKSKHDDAPDSLSGLCRFMRTKFVL